MEKWWELVKPVDESIVEFLSSQLGIHPVLAKILVQRGITTIESANAFFTPKLEYLHDPIILPGMSEAANRILLPYLTKKRSGFTAIMTLTALRLSRFCIFSSARLVAMLAIISPTARMKAMAFPGLAFRRLWMLARNYSSQLIVALRPLMTSSGPRKMDSMLLSQTITRRATYSPKQLLL